MAVVFLNLLSFYGALLLYVLSAGAFFGRREQWGRNFLLAGFACNCLAVVARTLRTGHLPLANSYEFILLLALTAVLVYLRLAPDIRQQVGGWLSLIVALLFGSVALLMPSQVTVSTELPPALQSLWLVSHVITAALSYGCFFLAAALATRQLLLRQGGEHRGERSALCLTNYRIILTGFVSLSVSVILGAVWAEQAWGSYWTWDPKETWALVTWIVYAIYLHLERRRYWTERVACWAVLLGFVVVVFTFFGVNFLLPGLHSYA
jgi:ABC-type transport system involved in cytochrome c biogenesis permease subunit